jgi:dTDP-4-amino-4,6-dideoxygalactose transaminase
VAEAFEVPFLDLKPAYAELKEPIDAALHRVLDRNWYLLGEELGAFEAEFAAYLAVPHAVGVANGLDALTLALQALGVGPGDEVLVPSYTFIATWLAVSGLGAIPVPVDVRPGTLNLDPELLESALSPRCKAVVPVHLCGQPADLDAVLDFARRHRLLVVEDAAQAHGAVYKGRRIGAHGDAVAWSFYPGKNLGAFADGGAVTTARGDVAERVRILRNYGSREKYQHSAKGRNSRLGELQAAVLRAKLPHLDAWNGRRAQVAEQYARGLRGVDRLVLPEVPGGGRVWHLFIVRHPLRDGLLDHLASRGVQAQIHYPVPPHLSGAYAADRVWPPLAVAETAAQSCLSLPMGPHLSPAQVEQVITAVRSFH